MLLAIIAVIAIKVLLSSKEILFTLNYIGRNYLISQDSIHYSIKCKLYNTIPSREIKIYLILFGTLFYSLFLYKHIQLIFFFKNKCIHVYLILEFFSSLRFQEIRTMIFVMLVYFPYTLPFFSFFSYFLFQTSSISGC